MLPGKAYLPQAQFSAALSQRVGISFVEVDIDVVRPAEGSYIGSCLGQTLLHQQVLLRQLDFQSLVERLHFTQGRTGRWQVFVASKQFLIQALYQPAGLHLGRNLIGEIQHPLFARWWERL